MPLFPNLRRIALPPCRWLFLTAVLLGPTVAAPAQPATTGTVTGRVLNPATGQYTSNAEVRAEGTDLMAVTATDGTYRLTGVPAGPSTISVTYTGYQPASAVVVVSAGAVATHDFELHSSLSHGSEVVQLSTFTVSAEREGNAKAFMDQKAAMNIKNSVASDVFGDVAEGNIGEFLKFMPGINLEYAEADTRTVHIRGLPSKYAAVTFDGERMSNAASSSLGTGRTFEFEQISINSVDSIEVNKTISADMDADAVAGSINLKSKSALNRKGRSIGWQFNAVANSYEFTLGRSPGPGDARHRKTLPGGILEFSDTLLGGRLGVVFTASESNMFNEQYRVQNTYDNVPTTSKPSPVVPVTIRIKDGPKFTERTAGSLNLDYRLNAYTILSLRSQFNWYDAQFHNRQLLLNVTRSTLNAASNATTMITDPQSATSTTVRAVLGGNSQEKFGDTGSVSPSIEFKRDNLEAEGKFTFSQSINHYDDLNKGFVYNYDAWLFPLTYRLTRSSADSKSWDFTPLSGRDLYSLASFQPSAQNNVVASQPRNSRDQQWSGKLDVKWIAPWHIPTYFKAGLKEREELYRLANYSYTWTYVGPANDRTQAVVPVSIIEMDPHKGGNIFSRWIQFPDRTALASLFHTHPEYFTPNPTNTTSDANRLARRYVKEQIDAAYLMANTRLGHLSFQGGARYERTRDGSKLYERGVRTFRSGDYDNLFLSGAAKYAFTANFRAVLSASQALLRPDFANLTGVASINDQNQTGTIPNPDLAPERSNNYSGRLEYYFEPVGFLGVGVFQNDIKDVQYQTSSIPAEQLGLGGDYPGYTFTSWRNASRLRVRGYELEYSQQLNFLPGVLRGLGVFANYTRNTATDVILAGKRAPGVASGGVSYRYRGYSAALKCVWTDDTYDSNVNSSTNVAMRYQRARTMFDLNLGAPLPYLRRASLFISGRNIFNAPAIIYENTRSLLYQHDQFGVTWTFGVKGTF